MGLFSRNKKTNSKTPEDSRRQEAIDSLKKFDPAVRPGGVFMVKLLMKEQCDMPSGQRIKEVLSKHLGKIEGFDEQSAEEEAKLKGFRSGFAMDYHSKFSDREVPVQLSILGCDPFDADKIDDMQRSQMWDCQADRDRILTECKYAVLANDMLGGGLNTGSCQYADGLSGGFAGAVSVLRGGIFYQHGQAAFGGHDPKE